MMSSGDSGKIFLTASSKARSSTCDVPKVSTKIDTGSATPIAYASWTCARSARSAATMFLAM